MSSGAETSGSDEGGGEAAVEAPEGGGKPEEVQPQDVMSAHRTMVALR